MLDQNKRLVQDSFNNQIQPISDAAASLFYARLFELDPGLRPLFKADMTAQRRMLMSALATAINGLDDLDTLVPVVESLGRRHVGYGVKDADYDTVGQALLDALQQGLGDDFTPEIKAAWAEVYALLASVMRNAAKGAEAAVAA
jgi:hemoglobin-like flavoprotein